MARVGILDNYGDIDADAWDALVGDGSPFLEHAFIEGLEAYECAVPDAGWAARPVLVFDDDDRIVAGAPGWLKGHSRGEFVYDHMWAHSAERAGITYYPKLIVAVPFTPVSGQRLLVAPGEPTNLRRTQLLAGLNHAARDTGGLHVLFNPVAEADWLTGYGLFTRLQFQFHWTNAEYSNFEDWLAHRFKSKDRNKIRRERRDVAREVTIEVVEAPGMEVVDTLYDFYVHTCEQFGHWGSVYLSRDFFHYLADKWSHRLHAVVARAGSRIVGGAFNVRKGDRLYGRYWGCSDAIRFLHFEVCYYQPVEWCIAEGLQVFEPGHGGGHKYRRGFLPVVTQSSHRLSDQRLHQALRDYTAREVAEVQREADWLIARRE